MYIDILEEKGKYKGNICEHWNMVYTILLHNAKDDWFTIYKECKQAHINGLLDKIYLDKDTDVDVYTHRDYDLWIKFNNSRLY